MSGGDACSNREHAGSWVVRHYMCNYSAFNGYHRTPSEYSQVWCPRCPRVWRTKAKYVDSLPGVNHEELERLLQEQRTTEGERGHDRDKEAKEEGADRQP